MEKATRKSPLQKRQAFLSKSKKDRDAMEKAFNAKYRLATTNDFVHGLQYFVGRMNTAGTEMQVSTVTPSGFFNKDASKFNDHLTRKEAYVLKGKKATVVDFKKVEVEKQKAAEAKAKATTKERKFAVAPVSEDKKSAPARKPVKKSAPKKAAKKAPAKKAAKKSR